MRVIHVDDEPEYGVALGSILVSLLEPAPGGAREFNRWYERDHFYAGCMSGQHFFSGRRFVAPRALRALREPKSSRAVDDATIGSFLALYWMERGHHREAEDWSLERVLWLYENGRMGPTNRKAVHASFYMHQWAVMRDDDGVPPEIALERGFPGLVMVLSERPEDVSVQARTRWMQESRLAEAMPGASAALCLSLTPIELPKASPAYRAPEPGFDRRHLELYFLDVTPDVAWAEEISPFADAQSQAGMGEVLFTAGFVPTLPGTDRYVDAV